MQSINKGTKYKVRSKDADKGNERKHCVYKTEINSFNHNNKI